MPNGEDKRLNFTFKVWDATAGAYRPVYIAPDATNTVQGDVKLSDATNSTLNAATGMTAATPAAVKAVADSANNKLDKIASSDQTVVSAVTFNNAITVNRGVTVPSGYFFKGNLQGNATTATTLQTSRKITLSGRVTGSANFNGGADATIATVIAAGSITATDLAADSVTSAKIADSAITGDKIANDTVTGEKIASGTITADNLATGSVTSAKIADGTIASDDVAFNYAGSSSKGGAATSAVQLATARDISLIGDVLGSASFNGTQNISIDADIAASAVSNAKIADGAVSTNKLAADSVNLSKLASDVGTTAIQSSQPSDSNVVLWVQI